MLTGKCAMILMCQKRGLGWPLAGPQGHQSTLLGRRHAAAMRSRGP